MQHLKKIPRTSVIQIWPKIWNFVYQSFEKNQSLWFSPQNFLKFLSNSVHFLNSHSRYVQNDFFTQGPTSFLKKSGSLRTFWTLLEKWMAANLLSGGWFTPFPASFRVKKKKPLIGILFSPKESKWSNLNFRAFLLKSLTDIGIKWC